MRSSSKLNDSFAVPPSDNRLSADRFFQAVSQPSSRTLDRPAFSARIQKRAPLEIGQKRRNRLLGKDDFLRSTQRIQGVLKEGDRFSFDLASFVDDYELRGVQPGQQIEINLKSNQFDAFLELRDARTRKLLLYGEDIDAFNSDSRLVFTAQPGVRYTVRVSMSPNPIPGSSSEGKYSLRSQKINPVPGFNFFYGYGLINAAAAVAQATGKPIPAANPTNSLNWGVDAIGAGTSWAQGFEGQNVVVAVLDTGVDYRHPDLVKNLWTNPKEIPANGIDDDQNGFIDDVNGWDFVSQDNDPTDQDGHGTAVAGIIAASPTAPSKGIAPRARIMPVRVISDNEAIEDSDSVAQGIRYAIRNGAKVINMSLSSSPGSSLFQPLPANMAALQEAYQAGVTVIFAAGNDRQDYGALRPLEPAYAALQGLGIAVGAVDRNLQLTDFSNPAGNRPLPFVVAPGVDIFSTDRNSSHRSDNSGTSFSAPFVSGGVALMLSANPKLTPAQISNILIATAATGGLGLYP